jgi:hypothetical protein
MKKEEKKKEKEANNVLMTAKSIIISDRQKSDINIEQQVISSRRMWLNVSCFS